MFSQKIISRANLKIFALLIAALTICLSLTAIAAPSAEASSVGIIKKGKIYGKNGNWGLVAKVKHPEDIANSNTSFCWGWYGDLQAVPNECLGGTNIKGNKIYMKRLNGKKPKSVNVLVIVNSKYDGTIRKVVNFKR